MKHAEDGHTSEWLDGVFERFETPLVVYAARLVGSADRGRDVVQDVFLRLCREAVRPTPERLAAWLYTVCRNRALDIRKKERRMSELSPATADGLSATCVDPSAVAEDHDEARRARALLDCLPDNQQEVIRLKIEHGLKYREISEVTGLSVSNVGYLLHQGLTTLRRQLGGVPAE